MPSIWDILYNIPVPDKLYLIIFNCLSFLWINCRLVAISNKEKNSVFFNQKCGDKTAVQDFVFKIMQIQLLCIV